MVFGYYHWVIKESNDTKSTSLFTLPTTLHTTNNSTESEKETNDDPNSATLGTIITLIILAMLVLIGVILFMYFWQDTSIEGPDNSPKLMSFKTVTFDSDILQNPSPELGQKQDIKVNVESTGTNTSFTES